MEYLDCAKKFQVPFLEEIRRKKVGIGLSCTFFLWAMWTLILKPRNLSCPADFPYFTSHYACESSYAGAKETIHILNVCN